MPQEFDLSAVAAAVQNPTSAPSAPTPSAPSAPAPSAPSPSSTPASQPSAGAGAASTPSPAPAGGQGAGGQPTPQQAWNIRNELRQLGMSGEFQDDQAAWQAFRQMLGNRMGSMQEQVRAGQYYMANRDKIAQAMQLLERGGGTPAGGAQGGAGGQPASPGNPWNPPPWKPEYERFLTRDSEGRVVAVPGADPSLPQQYETYRAWQADMFSKILNNPLEMLKPILEPWIAQVVNGGVQGAISGYQGSTVAQQEIERNSSWLFVHDANQRVVIDQMTGQRQLTEAGQVYAQTAQMLEQQGVRDPQVTARICEQAATNFLNQQVIRQAAANGGSLSPSVLAALGIGAPAPGGVPAPAPGGAPAPGAPGANGAGGSVNDQLRRRALNGASRLAAQGGAGTPPADGGGNGAADRNDPRVRGNRIHTLKQTLGQRLQGTVIE